MAGHEIQHRGKYYHFNAETGRWHDRQGEPVTNQGINAKLNTKLALGISSAINHHRRAAFVAHERETRPEATKPLPPDPEGQNEDRADWAIAASAQFQLETGSENGDALSDLLADLMHWCDRHGFTFNKELARARMHYHEETLNGGGA